MAENGGGKPPPGHASGVADDDPDEPAVPRTRARRLTEEQQAKVDAVVREHEQRKSDRVIALARPGSQAETSPVADDPHSDHDARARRDADVRAGLAGADALDAARERTDSAQLNANALRASMGRMPTPDPTGEDPITEANALLRGRVPTADRVDEALRLDSRPNGEPNDGEQTPFLARTRSRNKLRATRPMTTVIRDHMPALDGMRGIAVILVLLHTFDLLPHEGAAAYIRGLDEFFNAGWIGVQLFFVLSGFLITGILLDSREEPHYYKTFYTRRTLRIFPLYYAVLAVAFLILPALGIGPAGHGDHQGWLWSYTNNYAAAVGKGEAAFPHFWSLAVEEQFYLVWPFIVMMIGRRGVTILAPVMVVIAIAMRVWARHRFGEEAAYMFTPCRMDALALGALAAALVRSPNSIFDRIAPLALMLVGGGLLIVGLGMGAFNRTGTVMQYGGYTVIAFGFMLTLVGALDGSQVFQWKPLRRVGLYSYGMYVFGTPLHLFVGVRIVGEQPSFPVALLYIVGLLAVTFVCAAASYHLFEVRFLRLKAKLAP
ncbi:MAG: acyltransferase [Kofleriaceae bacterium]